MEAEKVEFINDKVKDNSFDAKHGSHELQYGYQANQALGVTRGKQFTKSKNKMKRGSYRGGQIDQGSYSIKFDNDE